MNSTGCAESELDDDNDGVTNDVDACPDTVIESLRQGAPYNPYEGEAGYRGMLSVIEAMGREVDSVYQMARSR